MILKNLYQELVQSASSYLVSLPDKPEETPDGAIRALWQKAAGVSVSVERARELELPRLDDEAIARLRELVAKRFSGIPLAYLTGRQNFMGLEMLADRSVLIPRKETELLSQSAIELLQKLTLEKERLTVVDVCTGSGNVALSMAHYVPQARIYASDLSPEAVDLSKLNVQHLGLEERVDVRNGDLLSPFDNPEFHRRVDLITCNPPYISSARVDRLPDEIIGYEPRLAFDGGPFGIRILYRFIQEAPRFLRKGGWIAFELGLGQGSAILKRMEKDGNFCNARPIHDGSGEVRGIMASVS